MSGKRGLGKRWLGALFVFVLLAGCAGNRFPWRAGGEPALLGLKLPVRTINEGYNRHASRVLVREVAYASRANLDYAAYVANVVLKQPRDERIGTFEGAQIGPRPFAGAIETSSLCGSLAQTKLTAAERAQPLAFVPMVEYLARWNADKAQGLQKTQGDVQGETWGLQRLPGVHYQEVTVAYVHRTSKGLELWVEIEFQPWAKLFDDMPDADGDGYPSVFGKVSASLIDPAIFEQLRSDYVTKTLDVGAVRRWANELASYWYPSYNTDVLEMGSHRQWPLPDTEKDVLAELGDLKVRPVAAIKGKPHGKAIYNLFVVPSLVGRATDERKGPVGDHAALKSVAVEAAAEATAAGISGELKRAGGRWSAWVAAVKPAHKAIKRQLKRRSKKLQALVGRDGFLFYRKSLDTIVGGDLQLQPKGKNPFATIVQFKTYLVERNIDFLVVPVPSKAEVFSEKLKLPPGERPSIHPFGRKFLFELAKAGVEVVDLVPVFSAARAQKADDGQWLYQRQDTHWTDRGLQLAAETVAKRIKRYRWYQTLAKGAVSYTTKRVTFKKHGDLHSRLASREQKRFKPVALVGQQVINPDGTPYEDDPNSPIVVLGDSFTGVYQRTDCEHAGLSAHVAREISYPVDLVMSYGGGPNVRRKLLSRGDDALRRKRLVVWVFAARDFHNYWEDWEPISAGNE